MATEFSFDEPAAPSAVAEVGDSILGTAPAVSEHAIAAHEQQTAQADASTPRDDAGTPFDSNIHTGTKLKNGTWRLKKAARAQSTVAAPRGKKAAVTEDTSAAAAANCAAAGAMAASSVFMLGRAFGGEEWEPSEPEVKMQSEAWTAYFTAKGVTEFPPSLALFIALGAYAGPRFQKPKTKERTRRVARWFVLRVAKWRIKRELAKRGITATVTVKDGEIFINGTRVDSWNNAEREDASS